MNRRTFTQGLAVAVALFLPVLASAAEVAAADTHTKGAKPRRIAQGQTVNLADYVVPGKTTVFDFTSKYCPPCEAIAPELDKLHAKRADIAVVAVDINRPETRGIDWKSPVAQQYSLRSIPHFKVYGPDGKLLAEDTPNDAKGRKMVMQWLNECLRVHRGRSAVARCARDPHGGLTRPEPREEWSHESYACCFSFLGRCALARWLALHRGALGPDGLWALWR